MRMIQRVCSLLVSGVRVVLGLTLFLSAGPAFAQGTFQGATVKSRVLSPYGRLPLSFEANQGQTDRRVKFLSRGHGYTLFLTPTEAVLALSKSAPQAEPPDPSQARFFEREKTITTALRIKLVGGNRHARLAGMEELLGKSNYFIGNDPKKWRTNVPTYGRVRVHDVYPGVNLMYYGNQRQLEEDFVVAPGGDARAITMDVAGAKKVSVDVQGELVISSLGGEVRLRKPVIYQRAGGVQHEIAGGYRLKGENRIGFELGEYDVREPLVIDPVLAYSTYLGGSADELGVAIAVDGAGNAYVTGCTNSTNFPTTSAAFQTTFHGNASCITGGSSFFSGDAFVTKLNPTGSGLVYSTYLGGSAGDGGRGIAVDAAGNAYVTGFTTSADFPTTSGAFQTNIVNAAGCSTFCPCPDAFVTKLNPAGSGLVYSSYLGGSFEDAGDAIAVDGAGNAYVTGSTQSPDFPTTLGAFQTTVVGVGGQCGSHAGFVTKINPTGNGLAYSTYLGNGDSDGGSFGSGIAVDPSGNAYVVGAASSNVWPTTSGAFQATPGGGEDATLTKLNPFGTGLVYSTYLGGSGNESAQGIALDTLASPNAYVTGQTSSTNFPTTPGAFQTASGGSSDAFVTKVNAFGSGLVYSTYLGGSGDDAGAGIAVDAAGDAFVAGSTTSSNFPIVNPVQGVFGGGTSDAFVTEVNPLGSALVYSTYLGGSGNESAPGIALDTSPSPNAYVTGTTFSTNFPTTAGAFQTTFSGGTSDAFVAKIAPTIGFALFSAKVEISAGPPPSFEVKGAFTLGSGSNGINPPGEPVTLEVASYLVTIPAGSFRQNKKGKYTFEGTINGVSLEVNITPTGGNSFSLAAEGQGVDLTGATNPVTVLLTIGDDGGSVPVNASFN